MSVEYNSQSELSAADTIYPTQADATEVLTFGPMGTVAAQEYPLILNAPYSGRITSVGIQSGSGSGAFTIKIGGIVVTGLTGKTVSIIEQEYIPTALNEFAYGQDISIQYTSVSSLSGVTINIDILRDTGIATSVSMTSGTETGASFLESVSAAFPIGYLLVDVPFGVTKLDESGSPTSNYRINPELPENTIDAVPDRIFATIVGRTPNKITLLLSAAPSTNNTIFRATIATASAATSILSAGSASGNGGIVSMTTLPLRGDGAGNAVPITAQSGDVATGLENQGLASSATYSASRLTGTIAQARLGSGSGGAGTKVLYDDQSYKLPPTGNVATDAIFTARGDIAVGTGSGASAKLTVGSPDTIPVSNNGATSTGISWIKIGAPNFHVNYIDPVAATAGIRTLGTGAQQAAPGNDTRIVGALQASGNLSAVASPATARTNLGLGSIATQAAPTGTVASSDNAITLTNKNIDGNQNALSNIPISAIQDYTTSTLVVTDPNASTILAWDNVFETFVFLVPVIAGSTGATTADSLSGTVKFAMGGSASLVLTNSYLTTGVRGITTLQAADSTAFACSFKNHEDGTATLTLNAAATDANLEVYWELRQ